MEEKPKPDDAKSTGAEDAESVPSESKESEDDDEMDAETFVASFYADLETLGANAVCSASGESKSNLKLCTQLCL